MFIKFEDESEIFFKLIRLIIVKLKPLYRSENNFLVGLAADFKELCVLDGLVVEVDIDSKKIIGDPVSGFSKLQSGEYTPIRQSEKKEYSKLIERKLKKRLIRKIEEELEAPDDIALNSLIWRPDRLGGNGYE